MKYYIKHPAAPDIQAAQRGAFICFIQRLSTGLSGDKR